MSRQLWIADRCRQYGLEVIEVDGWRTRGSESFNPHGVVMHHTGGASTGDMPSLRVLINGRSDLPGPLCNLGLSRSGKVYVVAAGRANHAGAGGWKGLTGNSSVLGIEAENDGHQPWPQVQLNAYFKAAAALTSGAVGHDTEMDCGHKEWAPSRKVDPHTLNMSVFRQSVAAIHPSTPQPPTLRKPMYDPPLQVVAQRLNPEGDGLVEVFVDGGVGVLGNQPHHGGPNNHSYWAGRKPADIEFVDRNTHQRFPNKGYAIIDTTDHVYGPNFDPTP